MSSTYSDVLTTAVDRVFLWLNVAAQVDTIRADIQNLIATVRPVASKQQVEDAIRQNPLSAVAIAAGLGFLLGTFTRR
jgi:ElaB/YqjD/DUF883 family membrane-anchored ribosome-binding protein